VLTGRYLNLMIIWPAITHRSNWTTYPTPDSHYACSYSNLLTSTSVYISVNAYSTLNVRVGANGRPRVLVCDGFGTHETHKVLEFCLSNNTVLCRVSNPTSHKLQPCDVALFAPLKAAYRDEVERLERGNVTAIGKEHSP
jgi:hypothetical protein